MLRKFVKMRSVIDNIIVHVQTSSKFKTEFACVFTYNSLIMLLVNFSVLLFLILSYCTVMLRYFDVFIYIYICYYFSLL